MLSSQVYCTLKATPFFSFSYIILGMQESWHATTIKLVENVMWNKVTLLAMKCHYQRVFHYTWGIYPYSGNAMWYFSCWLGGVRGFLNAGQQGCEHGSLSLIKQSGMTNKIVVCTAPPLGKPVIPGQQAQGEYTFHTQGDQQQISIFTVQIIEQLTGEAWRKQIMPSKSIAEQSDKWRAELLHLVKR